MNMTAFDPANSLNGRLVAFTKPDADDKARDVLRQVGGDEIPFARYHNVPVTTAGLIDDFYGLRDGAIASVVSHNKDVFRKLGVVQFTGTTKEAIDLYQTWGLSTDLKKVTPFVSFKPFLLTRRCVLFLGLARNTNRGKILREILGVDPNLGFNRICISAGLKTIKEKEEVEILKFPPVKAVKTKNSFNLQEKTSKIDLLISLLKDDGVISELNDEIESKEKQVEEMMKEIDRLDALRNALKGL